MKLLAVCTVSLFFLITGNAWAEININKADASQLMQELKNIGPVKAAAIVEYRKIHGDSKEGQRRLEHEIAGVKEDLGQKIADAQVKVTQWVVGLFHRLGSAHGHVVWRIPCRDDAGGDAVKTPAGIRTQRPAIVGRFYSLLGWYPEQGGPAPVLYSVPNNNPAGQSLSGASPCIDRGDKGEA